MAHDLFKNVRLGSVWNGYPGFSQRVGDLFNNPRLSDVTILLDNDDASDADEIKPFHGHRLVLCSSSDYFNAMLTGAFIEANQREIRLNGVPYSAFERCMSCLYRGWPGVLVVSWQEAYQLWSVCSMLLVEQKLLSTLEKWMSGYVGRWKDDIPMILALAAEHDLVKLKEACVQFCAGIGEDSSIPQAIFPSLSLAIIKEIVEQPFHPCRRSELFDPVHRWVVQNKATVSVQDRRYIMGKVAKRVDGLDQMMLSIAHVADKLVLPSSDSEQKTYCSQIRFHRCLKLCGFSIVLRSDGRSFDEGVRSEISLLITIVSSTLRNGQLCKRTECTRKGRVKFDFSQADSTPVRIFIPPVQCCREQRYRFEFATNGVGVHPQIALLKTTFSSQYVEVDNSYLLQMYVRDIEVDDEGCDSCVYLLTDEESG